MRQETPHRATWKVVFFNQYNILFLAGAGAFSLALASRWPAILGAAGEIFWLLTAFGNRRVRRWAVSHVLEQDRARREEKSAAVAQTLDPTYASRVEKLEAVGADIRRLVWERGLESALYSGEENRLESLLFAFSGSAAPPRSAWPVSWVTPTRTIRAGTGGFGSVAVRGEGRFRALLDAAGALIAQRRLEQQEQLGNELRLLGVRMGTLEMSLDYLRSQIFGGRSKQELSAEIAQMATNLSFVVNAEGVVESVGRVQPSVVPVTQPHIVRSS